MRLLLISCLFVFSSLYAKDSLQVHFSSWPAHADIYIGSRPTSFSKKASFSTPATIKLAQDTPSVTITLFKANYADTTLDVKIIPNINNEAFLFVLLSEELNEKKLNIQKRELAARTRRTYGQKLLWCTIPAAVATIVNGFILQHHINEANATSKKVDRILIRQTDEFKSLKNDSRHHTHLAENFKNGTLFSAGATALFLVVGFTLSF